MEKPPKQYVPVASFAKFYAEFDEKEQWNLVRDVINRSGKGGRDHYADFKKILKTACHIDLDIDAIEEKLKALEVTQKTGRQRLALLSDAFLNQWRKCGYRFFPVKGKEVTIAELTLKVAVDLGMASPTGEQVAVRLWLSKGIVSDKERHAIHYLLSEVKRIGKRPEDRRYGVWELESERVDRVLTVTDDLRNEIYEKAELFAQMYDALRR